MKNCMKWVLLFVLLVHGMPALAADKADLQAAYKKEFAFLDAERRNMQQRLKQLQNEGDERIRSAERELNALQSKLLGLSAQADGLSDRLMELDRDSEQVSEKQETLLAVFQQAQRSLAEYDVKVQEPDTDKPELLVEKIPDVYTQAALLLGELNTVRRQQGEFFLQNGILEKGDLILIGNVASYGVGTRGAGALAPVGDGRLKIWPEAAEEGGARLRSGYYSADFEHLFVRHEGKEHRTERGQDCTGRHRKRWGNRLGHCLYGIDHPGAGVVAYSVPVSGGVEYR